MSGKLKNIVEIVASLIILVKTVFLFSIQFRNQCRYSFKATTKKVQPSGAPRNLEDIEIILSTEPL